MRHIHRGSSLAKWLDGQCADLAIALKERYPEGEYVASNPGQYPDHVGVRVGDRILDVRGALTESEFLQDVHCATKVVPVDEDIVLLYAGLAGASRPFRTKELTEARKIVKDMLRSKIIT